MEYTSEVLDRKTGEILSQSNGDWITITELGEMYGVGPRQVRSVLRRMGILAMEHAGGTTHRHRLTEEAIKSGLGKHLIPRHKGAYPFDVISPMGQRWIADRWTGACAVNGSNPVNDEIASQLEAFKARRKSQLTPQMEVCWLLDHYPDISQADISSILSLPKQTVSHWVKLRLKHRNDALLRKTQSLPSIRGGREEIGARSEDNTFIDEHRDYLKVA
ncbi:hypothetical protein DK867_15945 [Ochrobactrum sp. POC9]|uniref:hypothetical protein n=1 Tax=Ochrobactrum sp. POC9 TaxID=2203419 RepID=UPI000D705DE0|nr:hypothetical protein [Ochrobactrum sp. POC9]PWU72057.1 hypothetical protein DK867_15945 [Ochrobactrum sp. POC9]